MVQADKADGGAALRRLMERELPQLVLLDVRLPGEDGFALARWLRERSGRIGIIMVTVATDTVDRVVGLESGADDYIAKPFEPRELLARVKSVLRRVTGTAPATGARVRMGCVVLDLEKRVLCNAGDGGETALTGSEFEGTVTTQRIPSRLRGDIRAIPAPASFPPSTMAAHAFIAGPMPTVDARAQALLSGRHRF
jgi:DNA-binding response OmpR family regulator